MSYSILGLDLGTSSIGWVLIEENESGGRIIDTGARVFPAGMDIDERSGKSTSHAADRREARGRRRLIERRRMRMDTVCHALQRAGLLPEGNRTEESGPLIEALRIDPYDLRQRALDHKLEPYEIGRIFFQLCRRRGFQTNRKSPEKEDDAGVVKKQTAETSEEMKEAGARTYGEFLAMKKSRDKRIRTKYTQRDWYRDEFDKIWEKQTEFYPDLLTDTLRKAIRKTLFDQRKLKSAKDLVGDCELEEGKKHAAIAILPFQKFRILQDVNNLIADLPDGDSRPLNAEERDAIICELMVCDKMTWAKAKKVANLPTSTHFNLENGDRKTLTGNRTAAKIIKVLGEKEWLALTEEQQEQMVEDIRSFENTKALIKRAAKHWGLTPEKAKEFANIRLEPDYANLSRKAIMKLLPPLEKGVTYGEARQKIYGESHVTKKFDLLPPIHDTFTLRNPVVERTLSELRKIVNALIRKHGLPDKIRIELARDVKKNSKQREDAVKRNRANEKEREAAKKRLLDEEGLQVPSRDDILKVLLAEECNWQCPYTGKQIKMHDLVGPAPKFDIEHIIPFSRSLDNSFMNKTLCDGEYNRNRKKKKTPWETAGSNDVEWDEITGRVKRFIGSAARAKMQRFLMRDVAEDEEAFAEAFSSTQLNDTRYASCLARDYVAHLYGTDWRKHVQVNTGTLTAKLRSAWGMNGILNDGERKTRDDHRHHAVDAIAIALSTPHWVQQLARAASRSDRPGASFPDVPLPWEGFLDDARQAIGNIIVSHRPEHRVNGQLHNETHYGIIQCRGKKGKTENRAVVRKWIDALSSAEMRKGAIVDPNVRRAVEEKLRDLDKEPAKAFAGAADPTTPIDNFPFLLSNSGERIPIRRVRVFQQYNPETIGAGKNSRNVNTASNFLLAVYDANDKKGKPTWRGEVVTLFDAIQGAKAHQPVAPEQDAEGNKLLFTLSKGDMVELEWKGEKLICAVQKMSAIPSPYYVFRRHNDARKAKDIPHIEVINFRSNANFFLSKCRKISINNIGEKR